MNNRQIGYVCAIRGPVLLIALGTLLAVDHFGTVSLARTWPILIIVLGIMKLLERLLASRPQQPLTEGGNQP